METVFITIHDLSQDASIRYCSDSVEDILGYLPHEVTGKSCWEYFHPEEIPFARAIQGRGISLDKAAVMSYARIKHKDGRWVGCECSFTVVYDVLVATTAIYRRGPKARQRALDGAGVRRIFSSSPRDPRYHMLQYLSNKFYQEPEIHSPEPRAALFLNRFSRTSTIMFATDSLATILGLEPADVIGKSFYYCIEENCLRDAVKALESAKANDSIAYLRFWYRNPLREDNRTHADSVGDEDEDEDGGVSLGARSSVSMTDASTPRQTEDGARLLDATTPLAPEQSSGVNLGPTAEHQSSRPSDARESGRSQTDQTLGLPVENNPTMGRSNSDQSADLDANAADTIFDRPATQRSSSSGTPPEDPRLEIEAVVSCSSDGLVVILRRARPLVPHRLGATEAPYYANGLFASPWAPEPVMPPSAYETAVAPPATSPGATEEESGFMAAIRDVAVFAWSLTGINGSLAQYAKGTPSPDALPPDGLPIWDPNADVDPLANEQYNGFLGSAHRPWAGLGGDPAEARKDEELGSSDDEVLWKRAPTMTPWRRPKRRAHHDAFGEDGVDGVDGENPRGGRKRPTRSSSGSGRAPGSGAASNSGPGSSSGTS
ncbi:PAS domain-containing protein [Cladophialophora carrionii]|uniref:PAS domain-containing protein n=1 Tax=Cladophialophora carrionii TaxID=86049 RepID=A0A1C1CRJ2_9EURO|nr:PAS domain-containing protein [Cladophialophora carrionii]